MAPEQVNLHANSCFEAFGIECSPGWAKLYQRLIDRARKEGVTVLQVKEHLGRWRFHVGTASDEFLNAIGVAEAHSLTICEVCGERGELRCNMAGPNFRGDVALTVAERIYAFMAERRRNMRRPKVRR